VDGPPPEAKLSCGWTVWPRPAKERARKATRAATKRPDNGTTTAPGMEAAR
jgi:hypothetical protein